MQIEFPFEIQETGIFGIIRRPVANVEFWSETINQWVPVKMIVDTGADYTLLPLWLSNKLGVNVNKDCREFKTSGVGGAQTVFLLKERWKTRLGNWIGNTTIGFIDDDTIPPLLGRLNFLERLTVTFSKFKTRFTD